MENIAATMENRVPKGYAERNRLTVAKLLAMESLDVIQEIKTANYCYGCTAGTGSSCGGALV